MNPEETFQLIQALNHKLESVDEKVNLIAATLVKCQTKCEAKTDIKKAKIVLFGTVITTLATIITTLIVKVI